MVENLNISTNDVISVKAGRGIIILVKFYVLCMHFKSANSIENSYWCQESSWFLWWIDGPSVYFFAPYFHQVCPKFCLWINFTIFILIVMDEAATTAQGGLFSPHTTDVTSKSQIFMKFEAKIMDIVLCNPKLTISSEIIMGSLGMVSRSCFMTKW